MFNTRLPKREFSLSNQEINRKTMLYVLPLLIILALPYLIFWSKNLFEELKLILITNFYLSLPVFLLGIVMHEFLHGITCTVFVKTRFKSIKFGISKKSFTPYCHCSKPIKLKYYLWGLIMPAVLLGILPVIFSWFTGIPAIFLFGLVFTLLAAADIILFTKLLKLDKNKLVEDLPDKPGCRLLDEN
jgi:hypothetical protein